MKGEQPMLYALVDFETMRKDVKKEYIVRKGDPRAEIAAKTQKSILEDAIVYSLSLIHIFEQVHIFLQPQMKLFQIQDRITD